MSFFMILGNELGTRLKSFTANTSSGPRGSKTTVTLKIEISDSLEARYVVSSLDQIMTDQKATEAAQKKAAADQKRKKPLALPPPQAALPKPEGR